jgi:GNAT superfamily N-acetyltransferase
MASYEVVTSDTVDPEKLHRFIVAAYDHKAGKPEFLRDHGAWLHRGDENRLAVITEAGEVAGYSSLIPAPILMNGKKQEAVWLIDVMVLPEYRGQGLQRMLDVPVRQRPELNLGFPNELAAIIHKKHGWGVRQTGHMMILRLFPLVLKRRFFGGSIQGQVVKVKTVLVDESIAKIRRRRLAQYQPAGAQRIAQPDAKELAAVFLNHLEHQFVTTYRDSSYIQNRFLDAPYANQLIFYRTPHLVLVAREAQFEDGPETRILDVWGDLHNESEMHDLLHLLARDAVIAGKLRIKALASVPILQGILAKMGFQQGFARLFCWYSDSPAEMAALENAHFHWTLADSDNDTTG